MKSTGSILLVTVLALLAACTGPLREPSPPVLVKEELPGITNFSRLQQSSGFAGERVGFGGATEPSAMAELKRRGYTTVINLRLAAERGAEIEASRAAAAEAGLNFVHLPFSPAGAEPDILDQFIAAASKADNQPIYVHCSSATRAAGLWMAARVRADKWSVEPAEEEAEMIAGRPERAAEIAEGLIAGATR